MTPPTHARVDAARLGDERALLVALGDVLGFPDYYGANWDAFEECLRDLPRSPGAPASLVLELAGAEAARARLGTGLDTLAAVWADAAPALADKGVELRLVLR